MRKTLYLSFFLLLLFHGVSYSDHTERLVEQRDIPPDIAEKISDIVHKCHTYSEKKIYFSEYKTVPVLIVYIRSELAEDRVGASAYDKRNGYLIVVSIIVPGCGEIRWERDLKNYDWQKKNISSYF